MENEVTNRPHVDSIEKKKVSVEKQPSLQKRLSLFLNQIQEVNSVQETSLEAARHSLSDCKTPLSGSRQKASMLSDQRIPFRAHRCSDIFMTQKEAGSKMANLIFNSRQKSNSKRSNMKPPPTPNYQYTSGSPVPEEQEMNKERVNSITQALSVSLKNSQESLRHQMIADIVRLKAATTSRRQHVEQVTKNNHEQSGLLFCMTDNKKQKIEEL